jgi:Rieske 2Fe-2S family protein
MNEQIRNALASWRNGYALPGLVYKSPELYEDEIRRIFLRAWHYVGHSSEIPRKGDYLLFEMAGESVIVVRDGEGKVNALLNVCRHRGSRICTPRKASTRRAGRSGACIAACSTA